MALTVEVRGDFDWQDGESSVLGTLYFTLTKRDYDGSTVIEPREQSVALNAAGEFTGVQLWPTDRGRSGARYKVEFQAANRARREVLHAGIVVPELGGPHQLASLMELTDAIVAARIPTLITMTQAQYDAALTDGTLTDGLYLVLVT